MMIDEQKERYLMAQNIKKRTILGIATLIGFFAGMRLYAQERRKLIEEKEKEREKRWSAMGL